MVADAVNATVVEEVTAVVIVVKTTDVAGCCCLDAIADVVETGVVDVVAAPDVAVVEVEDALILLVAFFFLVAGKVNCTIVKNVDVVATAVVFIMIILMWTFSIDTTFIVIDGYILLTLLLREINITLLL